MQIEIAPVPRKILALQLGRETPDCAVDYYYNHDCRFMFGPEEEQARAICAARGALGPSRGGPQPVFGDWQLPKCAAAIGPVRMILLDVYDTIMWSRPAIGGEIHEDKAAADRQGLEKAFQNIGYIPRADPADLLSAFKQFEQRQKRGWGARRSEHCFVPVWPEMDAVDIWRRIVPDLPPELAVPIATHYELERAVYGLMPGVADFLTTAVSKGIQVGIISNSQVYTPAILDALLIRAGGPRYEDLFKEPALQLYSHRSTLAGVPIMKPTVLLFEKALQLGAARLQDLKPEETLFIGNCGQNDGAALAAGMRFALCGVDRERVRNYEKDFLPDPESYFVFNSYAQLASALEPARMGLKGESSNG